MKPFFHIAFGALLTLVLASCGGEWKDVEYETGYEGPARWDPFLAAQRFVTEMGVPADFKIGLAELPAADDTMIIPSGAVGAYGVTATLYEWVHNGGHIVYLLEGGQRFLFDWGDLSSVEDLDKEESTEISKEETDEKDEKDEKDADPILKRFNIKQRQLKKNPTDVLLRGERFQVDIPSDQAFIDPAVAGGSNNNKKRRRTSLLTLAFGDGRITVISHAKPFRNRYIGEKDHARLLWAILNLHPGDSVWFVIGGRTSLWGMIWKYGWTVVIGLGLVIALWLWLRLSRFGPSLSPELNGTRDFFEHIDMTGKFLWRRGHTESLLEPLRQNIILGFQKKLHLAQPSGSNLAESDFDRIAEHTSLPVDLIRNAFSKNNITDAAELTRIVRDLQQIQSLQ
jgi:hypothetical protein